MNQCKIKIIVVCLVLLVAKINGCIIRCKLRRNTYAIGCHYWGLEEICVFNNCDGIVSIELDELIRGDRLLNFTSCKTLKRITVPYDRLENGTCHQILHNHRLELFHNNDDKITCEPDEQYVNGTMITEIVSEPSSTTSITTTTDQWASSDIADVTITDQRSSLDNITTTPTTDQRPSSDDITTTLHQLPSSDEVNTTHQRPSSDDITTTLDQLPSSVEVFTTTAADQWPSSDDFTTTPDQRPSSEGVTMTLDQQTSSYEVTSTTDKGPSSDDVTTAPDQRPSLDDITTTTATWPSSHKVTTPNQRRSIDIGHATNDANGGLICRAVLEQIEHNVDTFISLSSPQSGQFGDTVYTKYLFPNYIRDNLYKVLYTKDGQDLSVGNYWNDPHHQDLYVSVSKFLAVINNQTSNPKSQEYKSNFLRLKKLVMIGGPDDGVITPWQSSHFAFYDKDLNIVEMTKQQWYTQDSFGLRTLDERGALVTYVVPGVQHTHWARNNTVFKNYVLPYLT